ncbi:MAG TPA: metal ABC transporter ATP-binding protein [Halothiobacillaceae bacterium]|nr:metal ABC transporter ATP-binding protein [Halothiobacillaceae bacterium]
MPANLADQISNHPAPLHVTGLSVSYGDKPAVQSLDLNVAPASMTAIIGPNGAGKSTTLKAILNIIPKLSGQVRFFGQPLNKIRRKIAYVPQRATIDWDFPTRVFDVVLMGLYPQLGLLGWVRSQHRRKVKDCLERVGLAEFADRQIGALSGGQQQRVFLARALAQDAELYLLDEPFAGVDAATERAIIQVLHQLKAQSKTVVAVHHDLATVQDYFDQVVMINIHQIAAGPVASTFTAENLQRTYGGKLLAAQLQQLGLEPA